MNRARAFLVALVTLIVLTSGLAEATNGQRVATAIFPISAQFNGSSTYVQSGTNLGITGASPMSMAVWFKTPTPKATQFLLDFGASGNGNNIGLLTTSGGQLGWYNTTANNQGGTLVANAWTHGALTFDGTNVAVYLNGALVTGPQAITQTVTNGKLVIGESYAATSPFNGTLNDVCLWNVALSATQVQALYGGAVPTSGLIRRYKLVDGTTTPVDSSATGDTSTSSGLVWSSDSYSKSRLLGSFPYSLSFNGTTQYGSVATPAALQVSSRTVEGWINPGVVSANGPFLTAYNASGNYYFGLSSTQGLIGSYANSSGVQQTDITTTAYVAPWQWSHAAITWSLSGSTMTVTEYLNGVSVYQASHSGGSYATYGSTLYIGGYNGSSNYFPGKIAYVGFYNSALSSADIALRAQHLPASIGSPTEEWTFLDGSGTTLSGSAGDNFTLTSGTPWTNDVPPAATPNAQNLFTSSQAYSPAVWAKNNVSVSDNSALAPDGTTTASLLTDTATTSAHDIQQAATTYVFGATYTLSAYVKPGTLSWVFLGPQNGSVGTYFNVSTGTIGSTSAGLTNTITAAANGYYLCSVTYTRTIATGVGDRLYLASANGTVTYAGGTGTLYVWGLQHAETNQQLPYQPTTTLPFNLGPLRSVASTRTAVAQTQNMIPKSQSIAWTVQVHITPTLNAGIAPDNTTTATELTDSSDGSNALHYTYQAITGGAQHAPYTFSVYAAPGTLSWIYLEEANSGAGAYFNLSTGAVGTVSTSVSASIQSASNGFYRCSIFYQPAAGVTFIPTITMANANGGQSYTGSGSGTLYVWGAQVVQSNWPGPYQVTTTAAVNNGPIRWLASGPTPQGALPFPLLLSVVAGFLRRMRRRDRRRVLAVAAFAALLALVLAACAGAGILAPTSSLDRTCGAHGVDCGGGRCCDEGHVCGAPHTSCPVGVCCYEGEP